MPYLDASLFNLFTENKLGVRVLHLQTGNDFETDTLLGAFIVSFSTLLIRICARFVSTIN